MEVDNEERKDNNVLFEPEIYREANAAFEEAVAQTSENETMLGDSKVQGEAVKLLRATQIRCCLCGVMCAPNSANTCINCLKGQIDITEGIPRNVVMHHCRECNRYLRPPWVTCDWESAELLALCLKQLRGLKRVKLLDASFIYTEPHSRRIKVKLTV